MRTTGLIATLLGAIACSSVGANVKPVESPKRATVSSRASWTSFAHPLAGFIVDFPVPPEKWEHENPGGEEPGRNDGAACKVDGTLFTVFRLSRNGRALAKDEDVLESWRKGVKEATRSRPFTWETFSGLEVSGVSKTGGAFITRAHVVGDGLIVATVEADQGPIDAKRAERFLSSLAFAFPWSLRAFPEGGFSVILPAGAVELSLQQVQVQVPNTLVSKAFRMGGKHERVYSVMAAELKTEMADLEVAFPAIVDSLNKSGIDVIWHGAAHTDVGSAHDVLGQAKAGVTRVRYVFAGGRYFAIVAEATTQDLLLQPDVTRFLDSLTVY